MQFPVVPLALAAAFTLLAPGPVPGMERTMPAATFSSYVGVAATGVPAGAAVVGDSETPVTVNEMAVTVAADDATPGPTPSTRSSAPEPSTESVAPDSAVPVAPSAPVVTATRDSTGLVETAPIDTAKVQTVGLTWSADQDSAALRPQIRTKLDGMWSTWQPVPQSDNAPDPGSRESSRTRAGTDSVWIGDADAVQVGFAAHDAMTAADVKVALVGSGPATGGTARPAVWTGGSASLAVARSAAAVRTSAVAAPAIISRQQWGAAPQACTPDVAPTLVGAVVHHTADTNNYSTVAQAEQMIRNDQAYHINARGWCDIGYNFIVDKWGNIYEGRANSETQPVIGVHAGGFNTGTLGVAILGDYTGLVPSAATQEALAELIGWRLAAYGRNPGGMMSYTTYGGETSRWPTTTTGTTVTEPVVMGHRDVDYTSCPGDGAYSTLAWIRTRAQKIAFSEPLVESLYHDMLNRSADPQGLRTWTAAILGGTSASALGDAIAHSQEYASVRVSEAYHQILGRDPDGPGLVDWTARVTAGRVRIEDLRGWLIASDEYFQRAGGTNAAYVAQVYRDVLHRDAGPTEVAFWSLQIQQGGRGVVTAGIWRSLESAHLRVAEAYSTYLGRAPDPTGIATWSPYWQANGEDALRAMIIGSDEYLARAVASF